jgi:beta-1,4-mannosyltransferase
MAANLRVLSVDVISPDDRELPLVVLESFGPPRGRSNPYFPQMLAALPPSVEARYFSWRSALTGPFDVFHLHWPEVMVRGTTAPRSVVRGALFALLLARIRLQRKALVRTLHNLAPHEPVTRLQGRLIRMADRRATVWITLSEQIQPPTDAPSVVALHGHFRDWFAVPSDPPVPGRLLFFGRVRRYKGVDRLLAAFSHLPDDGASLHVVGKTEDDELAAELHQAEVEDPRVTAVDDFVSDEALAREIVQSELVVLPFVEMTNSSSMVLALSLDRPVLVPTLPVTSEMAAEVGPDWLLTYDGPLDAARLSHALDTVRRPGRSARPDLSRREWVPIGAAHARAFRLACDLARGSARGPERNEGR